MERARPQRKVGGDGIPGRERECVSRRAIPEPLHAHHDLARGDAGERVATSRVGGDGVCAALGGDAGVLEGLAGGGVTHGTAHDRGLLRFRADGRDRERGEHEESLQGHGGV